MATAHSAAGPAVRRAAAQRLRADVARWRAFTWRTPDWWLGGAALAAWTALAAMFAAMSSGLHEHGGGVLLGTGATHAMPSGVHDHGGGVLLGTGATHAMSYGALLGWWAAMVVAMMLPLVRGQARWLALRSLRRHRQKAVALFAAAFVATWVAAGAVALAVLGPVRGEPAAVALALAVAACWQCAAPRRRLLRRCGVLRAPAVHGPRAVADWGRAGVLSGGRCVVTCGALMAPMAIVHSPALMVGTALVLVSERGRGPNPETRGARRLEALWIGAAALATAALAVAA
ncbi:MAG: hypothetical protein QOJ35_3068 [Solirubrobacteraceae bacterium]|nr:hypothetical protein [Solirubrobacteraceae bacterium]